MEFSELIHTGWAQAELPRGPEALPLRGSLCVTLYHLLLSPGPASCVDLWLLLLRSVDFFEKQVASDSGTITLRCKDLRVLQLEIEGAEATLDIAPSIETNAWRLSEVNGDFSLCPRYPRAVIVPHVVDDDALARSARFGQGGRFPVLSYPLLPAAP
nr:myotubularin-related protein 9-like isoform X5 [Macaca nemestrina]